MVNFAVWLSCASEMDESPPPNLSRRMPPSNPASTSPAGGSSISCHSTQSALEKTWGSTFWGVYPFSLASPSAWLAASLRPGGSWTAHDLLDWGRAGEEGAQDVRDAGQARCVAVDPGPLIPNRGLWEGADVHAVVAEQLEVEGVGNFVFTSPLDRGDPIQKGGQRGVGGGGCR